MKPVFGPLQNSPLVQNERLVIGLEQNGQKMKKSKQNKNDQNSVTPNRANLVANFVSKLLQ